MDSLRLRGVGPVEGKLQDDVSAEGGGSLPGEFGGYKAGVPMLGIQGEEFAFSLQGYGNRSRCESSSGLRPVTVGMGPIRGDWRIWWGYFVGNS